MANTPRGNGEVIRMLLGAVDSADDERIGSLTTDDVQFRFGNSAPTNTQAELVAAARAFRGMIDGLRHTVVQLWEVDGTVIAVMSVHYRRLDGAELDLPCCNIFHLRGGVVNNYRIYMDVNPVLAP